MEISVKRMEDTTIMLSFTVPWKDVESERIKVIDSFVSSVEVPGFRKGKAPKKIAEEKLSKEKIQEELLRRIVTESYNKAIKKENITPIITPQVHIEAFEDGTDLKFSAETCELPQIDLKNYKEEIKKATSASKIVIPTEASKKVEDGKKAPSIDEIIEIVLKTVEVKLSNLLVSQEINRLISQMIDELKTMGLTLDQYLTSRSKSADDLKKEYEEKARNDLKLEFILRKIADEEKIIVEQKDIEEVLSTLKDEKQKAQVAQNPYMLASIIRQQKTVDFLTKL